MATVSALYRYPVKGLSPEPLTRVALAAGGTLPFDRAWAVENGPSGFDPAAPVTLPKIVYLMLMRNSRLAALATRYDDATGVLTVRHGGEIVARGSLATAAGRRVIETFLAAFEADELKGAPRLVSAPDFSFSDYPKKVVSLINTATVAAMSREFGQDLDPLRFRGNVYVEGLPPWAEFDFVGAELTVGDTRCEVVKRIQRCAATDVNPRTAERDTSIPVSLVRAYGHSDCGIYLRVLAGGSIAVGDTLRRSV
jgi:uncharacterized protein YcbX